MQITVIGGGAAGMTAALTAACAADTHVLLLERQARVGRKLAATGNGRCNLTNSRLSEAAYHGADPGFVRSALARFGTAETLDFFRSLGLYTVSEPDGKIYPYSDQANSVVDVLRLALEHAGVELRTGCELLSAEPAGGVFRLRIRGEDGESSLTSDRLIVAAGGAASGKLGGTMSGYGLLESFGHTRTALFPSLVQLKTDNSWTRQLKGVRAQAKISLVSGKRELAASRGEVQFAEFGLSGPAVFEISREAARAADGAQLLLDLCPQEDEAATRVFLAERIRSFRGLTVENLLTGMLHNRLGRVVLRRAGYAETQPVSALRPADAERIAAAIHGFSLPLQGTLGMDSAQVTAGGIRTDGFCAETLESRLCPGLFAAGEVLDIDGDCGGYNLQWAWASGRLAGLSAARAH